MSNVTSTDAGNHAKPHAVELDGVRYEFRHFGLPQLAEYERERYREERDRLRLLRDDYPTAAYVERLDRLRERYERHEFSFESEFADADQGGEDAGRGEGALTAQADRALLILRVMTGRTSAEVWRLLCSAPEEVQHVMKMVVAESFPKLTAGPAGAAPAAR